LDTTQLVIVFKLYDIPVLLDSSFTIFPDVFRWCEVEIFDFIVD